jgi:hypothetical protein
MTDMPRREIMPRRSSLIDSAVGIVCSRIARGAPSMLALLALLASEVFGQVTVDRPASILIYPEIVANGTHDTTIQIVNTSNAAVHARCFAANFVGTCAVGGAPCLSSHDCASCSGGGGETDFDIVLTKQQPLVWIASQGRGSGSTPLVPPLPPPFHGELVCVEVDSSAAPVSGNHLIGEATIVDKSSGEVAKHHAVGLEGFETNNGDNVLCLGGDVTVQCPTGAEYAACPDSWLMDFLPDGTADGIIGAGSTVHTNLTVVPCTQDFNSQRYPEPTVQFLVTNQQAFRFSASSNGLRETPLSSIDQANPNASIFSRSVLGTDYAQVLMRPATPFGSPPSPGFIPVAQEFHSSAAASASEALSPHPQGMYAIGDVITLPPAAAPITTALVSVNSAGTGVGNSFSLAPAISADGRFVAFTSAATDLVAGFVDANLQAVDVFVRDLCVSNGSPVLGCTPATTLVSVNSAGTAGANNNSLEAAISADGRFVAFTSESTDLIAGLVKGNGLEDDVYVRDLCVSDGNPVPGCTPATELVSVNGNGTATGNADSNGPSISADGRFVAFTSLSSDLVPNDVNGVSDVFVRDRATSSTELLSVSSTGTAGNAASSGASISADGRFVAYQSIANNLVANDTNAAADVFVRDRATSTTELVSVSSTGTAANGASSLASISADGRVVAFASSANNLVANDVNAVFDVFVRDRATSSTELVSVSSTGTAGDGSSGGVGGVSISADGRVVAFGSAATNFTTNDTNGFPDVFVRDRSASVTTLVSVNSAGSGTGNTFSNSPAISADGSAVSFAGFASDLVPNDTNGATDVFWRPLR